MTSERMDELLREALKCFEECSSPFYTEWLSEHNVTLDECGDLSLMIANAITVYLALPNFERTAILMEQAIEELSLPPAVKESMKLKIKQLRITKKLENKE